MSLSPSVLQPIEFDIKKLQNQVIEGKTSSENWRRLQLQRVETIVNESEQEIIASLSKDLKKPSTEAFFEIIAIKQEIKIAQRELSKWIKPKKFNTPIWLQPSDASSVPEPLGCVLIIGAWNYPFMLSLQPLISALAAGNTAVVKPSEYAPSTAKLIKNLFEQHIPADVVQVLEGDGAFTENLVRQKFDHIFFTGGSNIGKKVMAAAAENLTPITLELGGKNPALILEGANIDITAKRILWGKGLNAGQTCLAPNHLLVHQSIREELIAQMSKYLKKFYGNQPEKSDHMSMINPRQFERISTLIEEAQSNHAIIFGGKIDSKNKKISPTLIKVEKINDSIMSEEIFGPVIPLLTISGFEEACEIIRQDEKPLAIYMFGGTKQEQRKLISSTSSGGVCFNDVILQAGIPELPFGGIGLSGMGRYHGKAGFETFSNQKSILNRPFWLDINFRYPPYKIDTSILSKIMQ